MRVLFIGHYKEGSGWSTAAINTIMAMDAAGIDVVCRNVQLTNNTNTFINHKIALMENKPLQNIDVCIQNVLPHHIIGSQKFKKNIAYFVGESNTLKYSGWLKYLKLADEVWVPNRTLKSILIKDGINNVRVIPYAFDAEKYNKSSGSKINFVNNNHNFKFYYIGELNDRKNIESIVKCFHSEFGKSDQVSLIIKAKKFGIHPDNLRSHMQTMFKNIKEKLRIYKDINQYKEEIIITEDFSNDQIEALHRSCDCFVSPTHGEGWSIPSFEAMCYGNTPICSKEGGPLEYITDDKNTGWLVDGVYDVCCHSDPAFVTIFTGKEEWFHPSESEIKKAMRYYYENRDCKNTNAGLLSAQNFSYQNVGKIIKEAINDQ